MQEIRVETRNIRALLDAKYAFDFYQREYRWETKQITELIDDLAEQFSKSHNPGNERRAIKNYGRYFLGSIIISDSDEHKYVIDGQQRLTSLTLLFIYLINQLNDEGQKHQKTELTRLILSHRLDELSFNIDVAERKDCMEALLKGEAESFDETNQTESVINILHRYRDIEEYFPNELSDDTLPYFADWLTENVYMVELTTYSDTDAYTIFETMNDRGLSLTPTEMLKGYLLGNITDHGSRDLAKKVWETLVTKLKARGKEKEADAIKAWLFSQYANNIQDSRTESRDLDPISTRFNRWVRENKEDLGLSTSSDFSRFIQKDFAFYVKWYKKIDKAAVELKPNLEAIFFNAQTRLSLQYPMLLAALRPDDSKQVVIRKLRIVSGYIDIIINRQIWNLKSTWHSVARELMFSMIEDIRGLDTKNLAQVLETDLSKDPHTFSSNDQFKLIPRRNQRDVRQILARITDYIETKSGRKSRYTEYIGSSKDPYSLEHIWANHFSLHSDEFESQAEFAEYRNHIGGLLLLPRSFNMSYGNLPYEKKREHYIKHDLLAQSLHERAYENDPGFKKFIKESGLEFQPHPQFKKADLDARQLLYQKIAEQIWNPENLLKEAESEAI